MIEWAYKAVRLKMIDVGNGQQERELHQHGKDGWELVSVVADPKASYGGQCDHICYFKRAWR